MDGSTAIDGRIDCDRLTGQPPLIGGLTTMDGRINHSTARASSRPALRRRRRIAPQAPAGSTPKRPRQASPTLTDPRWDACVPCARAVGTRVRVAHPSSHARDPRAGRRKRLSTPCVCDCACVRDARVRAHGGGLPLIAWEGPALDAAGAVQDSENPPAALGGSRARARARARACVRVCVRVCVWCARCAHERKLSTLQTVALGSMRSSALIMPGGIGCPFCRGRGGGRGERDS